MNSRGQAMVEAVFVILLLLMLGIKFLQMSYLTWADLVVDRESHRLAICTMTEKSARRCESESRRRLRQLLFNYGELRRLQGQFQNSSPENYWAKSNIVFVTRFGTVAATRTLSEEHINKASRRWRY